MNADKTDFTQGSILKKLALFMLPILGSLILQAAYGAVDLLVVGRFGSTAGLGGAAVVFALLSAGMFVLLFFFARPISALMQAPAEALDLTVRYVRICGGGIFFIVAYNLLSAIFRGLGDSQSPLLFVLVACVVNIVGDLLLVAVFHLDAAGAESAAPNRIRTQKIRTRLPCNWKGSDFSYRPFPARHPRTNAQHPHFSTRTKPSDS